MQHGTKARNICCRHFNFHFNYSKNDFWHTKIFALRDPPFFKHSLLGTKICRPSKLSREREPNLAPPGPSVTSIRVQTAATRQFSPHRGSPTSISSQFLSSSPLLPCCSGGQLWGRNLFYLHCSWTISTSSVPILLKPQGQMTNDRSCSSTVL